MFKDFKKGFTESVTEEIIQILESLKKYIDIQSKRISLLEKKVKQLEGENNANT